MMWTEEAVEILRELALEGRSASVIAAALGEASRSAVIGKANRIGIKLNGGPGGGGARRGAGGYAPKAIGYDPPASSRGAKLPALSGAPERAWCFAEAEIGEMRRVGFEELRESICRWPLGDPMSGDFAYCGLKSANGRSYCAGHCRMAYQPPESRARRVWRAWRQSFALADAEPLP
jgi:GcrA cell cycle regulator